MQFLPIVSLNQNLNTIPPPLTPQQPFPLLPLPPIPSFISSFISFTDISTSIANLLPLFSLLAFFPFFYIQLGSCHQRNCINIRHGYLIYVCCCVCVCVCVCVFLSNCIFTGLNQARFVPSFDIIQYHTSFLGTHS